MCFLSSCCSVLWTGQAHGEQQVQLGSEVQSARAREADPLEAGRVNARLAREGYQVHVSEWEREREAGKNRERETGR